MSNIANKKKTDQLGMPHGTASAKLRKSIIFSLVKKLKENYCFQCGAEIEYEKDLSVEHKIPYLDSENPQFLFFDLENIAFSHLRCNISAARQTKERIHPSHSAYRNGCRCDECRKIESIRRKNQREKGIKT